MNTALWLWKRAEAHRLLANGATSIAIAERVGVCRQTVYKWKRLYEAGTPPALTALPTRGAKCRLPEEQMRQLAGALQEPPDAHGLHGPSWTSSSFQTLIERDMGVRYSTTQAWRLMSRLRTPAAASSP